MGWPKPPGVAVAGIRLSRDWPKWPPHENNKSRPSAVHATPFTFQRLGRQLRGASSRHTAGGERNDEDRTPAKGSFPYERHVCAVGRGHWAEIAHVSVARRLGQLPCLLVLLAVGGEQPDTTRTIA